MDPLQDLVDSLQNSSNQLADVLKASLGSKHAAGARLPSWLGHDTGVEDRLRHICILATFYGVLWLSLLHRLTASSDNTRACDISFDRVVEQASVHLRRIGLAPPREPFFDELLARVHSSQFEEPARLLLESATQFDGDLVGSAYEKLVHRYYRRRFGQFFTPQTIADTLAKWVVQEGSSSILDPAVGSGRLLVATLRESSSRRKTRPMPRLFGLDVSPLADLMSLFNLLQYGSPEGLQIATGNFLLAEVGKPFSPISIPLVDSIICNPPNTRHQEINPEYKERLVDQSSFESAERIRAESSIFVHFIVHANQFLSKGGRMALVTPSGYLGTRYGVALKSFLLKAFRIAGIVLLDENESVFSTNMTTACMVFLEKTEPGTNEVRFVRVQKDFEPKAIVETLSGGNGAVFPRLTYRHIPQALLTPTSKWTGYFEEEPARTLRSPIRLGSIARIHRGIATGANRFFALPQAAVDELGLERRFLSRVLTNAKDVPFFDIDYTDWLVLRRRGRPVWLLSIPRNEQNLSEQLLRYIRQGEISGFDKRYLTRKRQRWFEVEQRVPAPILFTSVFSSSPRFILAKTRLRPLNTLHCIYPEKKMLGEPEAAKALLAYLNSSFGQKSVEACARSYGKGMKKAEPGDLAQIAVPDLSCMDRRTIEKLAWHFDELCQQSRKGELAAGLQSLNQAIVRLRLVKNST